MKNLTWLGSGFRWIVLEMFLFVFIIVAAENLVGAAYFLSNPETHEDLLIRIRIQSRIRIFLHIKFLQIMREEALFVFDYRHTSISLKTW